MHRHQLRLPRGAVKSRVISPGSWLQVIGNITKIGRNTQGSGLKLLMLMEGSGKQAVKCKTPLWVTDCRWGKKKKSDYFNEQRQLQSFTPQHSHISAWLPQLKQKAKPRTTGAWKHLWKPRKIKHKLLHSKGCFHYRSLAENNSLEMALWKFAPGLQLPQQARPPRQRVSFHLREQ